MQLCRLRLILPLAVVVSLFAAAPASADIVAFESIAGFELGMAESQVRDELGEPSSVEEGPFAGSEILVYERRKLEFAVADGRVGRITTQSRAQKMSNGIGVGTSYSTLRRKLRGERCQKLRRYRVCSITRDDAEMSFTTRRNRVDSISLAAAVAGPPQQR